MQFRFNIDLEKINEANGQKAEALFKYLKNTAKNKTPLILRGTKVDGFWDCDIYECAIPASHFTSIKLPAEKDVNANGAKMYALLSEKLLVQFVPGAEYFFKETEVNIKRDSAKVRDSYKQTVDQLECQLTIIIIVNIHPADSTIQTIFTNCFKRPLKAFIECLSKNLCISIIVRLYCDRLSKKIIAFLINHFLVLIINNSVVW